MPYKGTPEVKHDDPTMVGQRSHTKEGTLRRKLGDTHAGTIGTIEEQYHADFGVRSDILLDTLLERQGLSSLSQLLRKRRG